VAFAWLFISFNTSFSDFGTTTSLGMGNVIMSTDYDAIDSPYASELQMQNAQYTQSSKPSESFVHCIECDPSITQVPLKNVRPGGFPANTDKRFYDWGTFQIATIGLPTGSSGVIGKLWCTYDIELVKPALDGGQIGGSCLTDHFVLPFASLSATSSYLTSSTSAAMSAAVGSSIGGTIQGSTYTFPSWITNGYYNVNYNVIGATNSTLTTQMSMSFSNCAGVTTLLQNNTSSLYRVNSGATSGLQTITQIINVSPNLNPSTNSASITFLAGTLPSSITAGDFFVTQWCDGVLT